VNTPSHSLYAIPIHLSSVTLTHPTQAVQMFHNISRHLVPWPSVDIHGKFYRDRPRGTLCWGS